MSSSDSVSGSVDQFCGALTQIRPDSHACHDSIIALHDYYVITKMGTKLEHKMA